jgi:hypothetical protein
MKIAGKHWQIHRSSPVGTVEASMKLSIVPTGRAAVSRFGTSIVPTGHANNLWTPIVCNNEACRPRLHDVGPWGLRIFAENAARRIHFIGRPPSSGTGFALVTNNQVRRSVAGGSYVNAAY